MAPRKKFGQHTRVKLVGSELTLNFDGKGIEEWLERLERFETTTKDLRPVFNDFGAYQLKSIDRNFTSEGRPGKWTQLAQSTVEQRRRLGYGGRHPILQRTKKLRRGFKKKATKRTLSIINRIPWFKYHQQDKRKGKVMPRRIMVILLNQDKAQFTRTFRKYATGD